MPGPWDVYVALSDYSIVGVFRSVEKAKEACQKQSQELLDWDQLKNGRWYAATKAGREYTIAPSPMNE